MSSRLRGAIAASVTPLASGGSAVDIAAIHGLVPFLKDGDVDGALIAGTTGEGVLLTLEERRAVAEAFVAAGNDGFQVAIHTGAQTTADTIALSAHARDIGAQAVAVIAPPYFPLDADELTAHLVKAAEAADPLPFYVYEFAGRSGYAIPTAVISDVCAAAPNVAGMKVSDSPFEAVEPYLDLSLELGIDVFIGNEPLAMQGMDRGAVGCVSGLAAAFPEATAALVHDRSEAAHEQVRRLRDGLAGIPFHAALKAVLVARGVLAAADVRPPLRGLTQAERDRVLSLASAWGVV